MKVRDFHGSEVGIASYCALVVGVYPNLNVESNWLCSRWGFEKLVFRKLLPRGRHYDRKYVVQARHAEAAGIHMSMNMRKGSNAYP